MGEVVDLKGKVRMYYSFTNSEIVGFVAAITLVAFIISFKEWGYESFDAASGLFNFFNAILIVALSFIIHDAGQRLAGLAIGFRIEYKVWTFGLIFALILVFVSNGRLWAIFPSYFVVHHMAGHRLGFFRYGINKMAIAMIALAGSLATISLVIVLKFISAFVSTPLLEKAIFFNVIYVVTSMLPVPNFDGSHIYFASRMAYAFTMPFIVVSAFLLILKINTIFALASSLLLGIILWLAYYIFFEKNLWNGPK